MGKWKIKVLAFVGLALLMASALGFAGVLTGHIGFGTITTGFITKYHEQPTGSGKFKQDLSGVATDGEVIIFADDGGDPALADFGFNYIRVTTGLPDTDAVNLPLTLVHKDMEGATFWKGHFVVTTSMSKVDDPAFRRLTRFRVNENQSQLISEKSVDLRDQLMESLREEFGDAWFDRIKNADERAGGLNIEGLSRTGDAERESLYLGIRGPLFGENFPTNLRNGVAIIAEVERPFSNNPSFNFSTLDLRNNLGNHGVRGMEWIPAMKGFVIIGGPVAAANDYSLWFWDGDGGLERLDLPDTAAGSLGNLFRKLCRPESVFQMEENGDKFLVVTSEQSGAPVPCSPAEPDPPPPFTFIKAQIVSGD